MFPGRPTLLAAVSSLALSFSPAAHATGKAVTFSVAPAHILNAIFEATFETMLSQSNKSLYASLGIGLPSGLLTIHQVFGYRFYAVGNYYSGLTVGGDIGVVNVVDYDETIVYTRGLVGWKQVFSGLVLDGSAGPLLMLDDYGGITSSVALRANIGFAF